MVGGGERCEDRWRRGRQWEAQGERKIANRETRGCNFPGEVAGEKEKQRERERERAREGGKEREEVATIRMKRR